MVRSIVQSRVKEGLQLTEHSLGHGDIAHGHPVFSMKPLTVKAAVVKDNANKRLP